jgi:hypothetical protein
MLHSAGLRNDIGPTVHLFRSQAAAYLRQIFITRPRLWLPLFPAFYLTVRIADRIFNDTKGQILVITAAR